MQHTCLFQFYISATLHSHFWRNKWRVLPFIVSFLTGLNASTNQEIHREKWNFFFKKERACRGWKTQKPWTINFFLSFKRLVGNRWEERSGGWTTLKIKQLTWNFSYSIQLEIFFNKKMKWATNLKVFVKNVVNYITFIVHSGRS